MTTGYAPPKVPSLRSGTPPNEWSESVLASTPNRDTPAAFPEHAKMSSGQTAEKVTAKEYVPERVEKAVDYAGTAAASRLPDFRGTKDIVSSHLSPEQREKKPRVSLPSTELKGAQPAEHTGGVGALPGNLSESSVALLPDERKERAQEHRSTPPRQRRETIKPSAAGGDDEEADVPREAALSKDEPITSQPDAEIVESYIAASSGPGVESQKKASQTKTQQVPREQRQEATVAATGAVGSEPCAKESGQGVEGSNLAPEKLGQGQGPPQGIQNKGNATSIKKAEGGYGGEYHPGQLHPSPSEASAAEHQTWLGAQQEGQDLPARTGKRASVNAEKKPGFMTMMKGEMKILAGKMSGDEQQVEEGKRIIHGEA